MRTHTGEVQRMRENSSILSTTSLRQPWLPLRPLAGRRGDRTLVVCVLLTVFPIFLAARLPITPGRSHRAGSDEPSRPLTGLILSKNIWSSQPGTRVGDVRKGISLLIRELSPAYI